MILQYRRSLVTLNLAGAFLQATMLIGHYLMYLTNNFTAMQVLKNLDILSPTY